MIVTVRSGFFETTVHKFDCSNEDPPMTEHDSNSSRNPFEQYRCVTYKLENKAVSVIQDTENKDAWIQSTHAVAVER